MSGSQTTALVAATNSTASSMGFWTYSGSSWGERMRLDPSGNLGLGVTPSSWSNGKAVEVGTVGNAVWGFGSTYLTNNAYYNAGWKYAANAGASFYQQGSGVHYWLTAPSGAINTAISALNQAMTLDASGNLLLGQTTNPSSYRVIVNTGGATTALSLTNNANADLNFSLNSGVSLISPTTGTLAFGTSSTERARIDSSGNFLIGTTTNGKITLFGSGFSEAGAAGIDIQHISGSVTGDYYQSFQYGGSVIGSITQSGTTAVLFNVTSDQRLKENIVDAPEFGSVIDSIKVRSYDWKADGNHQRAGFVAQELVTVAPEAVHQPADPEAMMAVDYSKLVPMLVKEIQSLRTRLAALEAK